MKTTIDIINNPEVNKAISECVDRSIQACNSCGATWDYQYLELKWERRVIDAFSAKCHTFNDLMAVMEDRYAF